MSEYVSRYETRYERVSDAVHVYSIDIYENSSELARMNNGEYLCEQRILFVFPSHAVLYVSNDAIDESVLVDPAQYGFDRSAPSAQETIDEIAQHIVDEYEAELAEEDARLSKL